MPVYVLRQEIVHPCAPALRRPREVVGHQIADKRAVRIGHFKRLHIRMIDLHAVQFAEIQTVQSGCIGKDPFPDILHPEIRSCLRLVQTVFPLTDTSGIIRPVPRTDDGSGIIGKNPRLHIFIHYLLHVRYLLLRPGHGRTEDCLQKRVHRSGITGHLV